MFQNNVDVPPAACRLVPCHAQHALTASMQGDGQSESPSSSDAETPKAQGRSPEPRRRSLLPWRRSEEQALMAFVQLESLEVS